MCSVCIDCLLFLWSSPGVERGYRCEKRVIFPNEYLYDKFDDGKFSKRRFRIAVHVVARESQATIPTPCRNSLQRLSIERQTKMKMKWLIDKIRLNASLICKLIDFEFESMISNRANDRQRFHKLVKEPLCGLYSGSPVVGRRTNTACLNVVKVWYIDWWLPLAWPIDYRRPNGIPTIWWTAIISAKYCSIRKMMSTWLQLSNEWRRWCAFRGKWNRFACIWWRPIAFRWAALGHHFQRRFCQLDFPWTNSSLAR